MAPRPTWKGYLKLSLVSCAVAMYTATSTSSRIRLHIINRETGNRIRNQAIDSDRTEGSAKKMGGDIKEGAGKATDNGNQAYTFRHIVKDLRRALSLPVRHIP